LMHKQALPGFINQAGSVAGQPDALGPLAPVCLERRIVPTQAGGRLS
jgi:hypothetical protein